MSEEKKITTLTPPKPNTPGYYVTKDVGGGNMEYYCVICGPITQPEPWYGLIELLETAKEGDVVFLDFNTPGGWVTTGCVLANAILHSKAEVVGTAMSMTASIGAMMLVACDIIKVGQLATVMFHGSSGGYFGKTVDNEEDAHQMNQYFQRLLRSVGKRLLTDEEIDEIIEQRVDKYKSAKEILAILEGQKPDATLESTEDPEPSVEPEVSEESPEPNTEPIIEDGGDSDE